MPVTSMAKSAQHIVILFHDFPPGGSERIMIRLANCWARLGRQVTILCGSENGPARVRVSSDVSVIRTDPELKRGPMSRLLFGQAVARMLPSMEADIIVAPGNFHLSVLRAVGPSKVPMVCKLSNTLDRPTRGLFDDIRSALLVRKIRMNCRRLAAVMAISPALAREAEDFLPETPVLLVPQPNFAKDYRLPPARKLRRPQRILCAGRIVAQKNLTLALHAFALHAETGATLTVAGDGPERPRMEAMAAALGLAKRVHFTGHVPDIAPLLAQSDLLLSTSVFEGYPGVVVEALAAGVPVVSTRSSPAIEEIIDNPSFGRIAEARPEALAKAMRDVAWQDGPDRVRLQALVERHRETFAAEIWLTRLDALVAARSSPWHRMPAIETDIPREAAQAA